MQTMATRGAPNRSRVEPCGFDENVLCGGRDHRVPPTHHTGERKCFLLIGHDQIIGNQGALGAVEQAKFFACMGATDDDAAFKLVEIEGVGWMTDRHGDKVGGVHGVADQFLFEQGETLRDFSRPMARC